MPPAKMTSGWHSEVVKSLGMGVMVGFGPVVIFVLGPTVFHGLEIGFIICVFVFEAIPWVAAAIVFIAVAITANESLVSLLLCFRYGYSCVCLFGALVLQG